MVRASIRVYCEYRPALSRHPSVFTWTSPINLHLSTTKETRHNMETIFQKSQAAVQPFVTEVTTTKSPSPRYLKELIVRATSAPTAYSFTPLLETPAIQTLKTADAEHRAYYTVLQLFSYGTYHEYISTPGLPQLTPIQAEKLRLLSLLSLASPFLPLDFSTQATPEPFSYTNLQQTLHLDTPAQLEQLVTTAIYNHLLTSSLSPTSTPPVVHIKSVAPVRDPRPGSVPATLAILTTWSNRCQRTISEIEAQITEIRTSAAHRTRQNAAQQHLVDQAVNELESEVAQGARARNRQGNKRDLDERMEGEYEEEGVSSDEVRATDQKSQEDNRASSSKHPLGTGPAAGRGSKRNRGRGGLSV